MFIKQLSVFVENKPGRLAEITAVIAAAGVDIRALSIADTTDFGILRLVVDKPADAHRALTEAGMTVSLTDVFAVGISDRPGGFAEAMKCFSESDVSIEYMYAFVSRESGKAYLIMRVKNTDKAAALLKNSGLDFLTESDVYNI